MTQLQPTELFAIPIPEHCNLYEMLLDGVKLRFFNVDVWSSNHPDYIPLGTVTKDEISFSCEDLVKSLPHHYDYKKRLYVDYCNNDRFEKSLKKHYSFDNSYDSFLSLLKANEVYLENPLGEEPIYLDKKSDLPITEFEYVNNWQIAQSKTNTKYLILKKQ